MSTGNESEKSLQSAMDSSHRLIQIPHCPGEEMEAPNLMECQRQAQTSEFLEPAGDKPGESEGCLPQTFMPALLSSPTNPGESWINWE